MTLFAVGPLCTYNSISYTKYIPKLSIYSTEQLTGDVGFAVDTQKFGILCRKNTLEAKLSSDGKNALVNNVAYLRMLSRMNLAVMNINANMKFDFSDVKAALETP